MNIWHDVMNICVHDMSRNIYMLVVVHMLNNWVDASLNLGSQNRSFYAWII